MDKEKAELEVDAMFAKTPEEKAAVEEKMKALDAKYEDLNGRKSENACSLSLFLIHNVVSDIAPPHTAHNKL